MPFLETLGYPAPGWQGRLQEAAYTSPAGRRHLFAYEQVSRDTTRRTTKFQFNGLDGWYVQDNGHSGRDYPLRCIFWGNDHDVLATAFEAACLEAGKGRLEHPMYGTFDVVPTGTVSRRNDLVNEANHSIVEVTFSTTLAEIYPSGTGFPTSEISQSVDAFSVAAAGEFESGTDLATTVAQSNTKNAVRNALAQVRASLESVAAQTAEAKREFDSNFRLINEGIDVLIGQPLLLAQQISNLIQAPGRAIAGIANRLAGYRDLLGRIIGSNGSGSDGATLPSGVQTVVNDFRVADLVVLNAVAGSLISVVNNTFESRPAALQAAENVAIQLDDAVAWREERFEGLAAQDALDEGGAYQQIQDATAQAVGYLVELSFDLLPERRLVTTRARTIVDLCAELYADLSDRRLQFFIDTNRFTGSEILEVPKGRTVVWYA